MQVGDKMYRYFDAIEDFEFGIDIFDGATISKFYIAEYEVVKLTPCGCWVSYPYTVYGTRWKKFINNSSRKKYAWSTKEEAFNSFVIRKRKQVEILTSQLERAKFNLELAEKGFQP